MAPSQIVTTMFNIVGVNVVYNGAGRHIEHVSEAELKRWFMVRTELHTIRKRKRCLTGVVSSFTTHARVPTS